MLGGVNRRGAWRGRLLRRFLAGLFLRGGRNIV